MCVSIFSATLTETFLILRITERTVEWQWFEWSLSGVVSRVSCGVSDRATGTSYLPAWADWWNRLLTELVSAFSHQQSYSGGVRGRSFECSCRSIMLRQDELAFMKAICTLQVSPALLKELRLAMARRKKKQAVPSGRCSTTSGSGTRASQQLAGKRKASELASSGESMEPANRLAAPGAVSVPLPATSTVTVEQAAASSRQRGSSGGGGNVRACIGRARRPVSAKSAAQAHSHGFGPIRTRCLNGDNQ